MEAHRVDNAVSHIADWANWSAWDGSELWSRKLARLLDGSDEHLVDRCIRCNGDGSATVVYERADGQVAVIGATGCYLYGSKKLWQAHMETGKPGPEVLGFD